MTFFVGICGGTGSGKSTLAKSLATEYGNKNSATIPIDSYYKENYDSQKNATQNSINLDQLEALDIPLLAEHIDKLKNGEEIVLPSSTNVKNQSEQVIEIVEPKPVIILEGVLLFAFESIRKRLDYTIFRDCPENIRFERRRKKDTQERGLQLQAVSQELAQIVKPMHDLFVQPYRHKANFITLHDNNLYEVTAQITQEIDSQIALFKSESSLRSTAENATSSNIQA